MLRAHLEAQEFSRRSWGDGYQTRLDLVFCHPDGSPYDPDVVRRRFERRTELCPGVVRIRFHDMRHTHATLLLEAGETERYVAERLGDTVEMIHETYGHVTPKMRVAAVKRLAARLTTPPTDALTIRDRSVTESDSVAGRKSSSELPWVRWRLLSLGIEGVECPHRTRAST
jgi:Phage integrase family